MRMVAKNNLRPLTNPGTGELTPAEILKPSVVYESPKVNKNLVVPQVSFPATSWAGRDAVNKTAINDFRESMTGSKETVRWITP